MKLSLLLLLPRRLPGRLALTLCSTVGLLSEVQAVAVPYYLATGMQPLIAGAQQAVLAFSNSGIVWGGAPNGYDPYAFQWSPGSGSRLVDTFHSPNYSLRECAVTDVSASGLLVGNCRGQMVQWTASGAQTLAADASAIAVNNQGWVVGSGSTSSVVWKPGTGLTTLGSSFVATDLNNQGLFVGAAGGAAALGSFAADGSFLTSLVGAGPNSSLTAVNDQGLFVGNDSSGRSFMGSVGATPQQLALPTGYTQSFVSGVNSSGVAVGLVSNGSLYAGQIVKREVAIWQGGTVRLLDIRNLLSQYWSPYQTAVAVPTFFNVHINDSGQIALNGLVNGVDSFGYLLNACQRCGQIKPNPNPDGSVIDVAPDWEQATNGEVFDNRGQIALSTTMDNTNNLDTSAAGHIVVHTAGHLVNQSRMTFTDSTATPYGYSLAVHMGGVFEVAPTGTVVHAGTTRVGQQGTVLIDGVWNAHQGALMQVQSGGLLSVRDGGIFSNQPGATLQVQSNGEATFARGSSLLNFGNVDVEAGTLTVAGALFNGVGATINISGTNTRTGLFSTSADPQQRVENFGTIHILSAGQWTVDGVVLSHAGSRIRTFQDAFGEGRLTVNASADLTFDVDSGASLYGSPVSLVGSIHSAGTINFASGIDGMGPTSVLANESRGVMEFAYAPEIHGRFSMYGGSQTSVSDITGNRLVNLGAITIDARETRLNVLPGARLFWSFTGATLPTAANFYSGVTNSSGGVVQVLNGASLLVGSNGFTNGGGQLSIDERSRLAAASSGSTDFRQWDGMLEVDGRMDVATFDCIGGSVAGTGRINTSGDFGITNGCTIAPGSGLAVNGAPLAFAPRGLSAPSKVQSAAVHVPAGQATGSFTPGTLLLSGNVHFDNAQFAMAVSDVAASKLVIEGNAQFNGGMLKISFLEGAMADPDASLEMFSLGNCNNCGLPSLGVTVEAADPNWAGAVSVNNSSGTGSVRVDNAAAIDLGLTAAPEQVLAAGTTVYNRGYAQLNVGLRLLNDGAFYNRTGAEIILVGDFTNRSGGQMMNHGWILNTGAMSNEVGAVLNNRGTIRNDGIQPGLASIINKGLFVNYADGRIDNASQSAGQIVNESTGRFINRGLITNNAAYSQLETSGGAWFVNRGLLENHGSMVGTIAGLMLNDGGAVIIHDTGVIQTGGYRQTVSSQGFVIGQAPAQTVVNGRLEVFGDIALGSGTRLGGTGTLVGRVVGGVIAPGYPTGTLSVNGSVLYSELDVLFDASGNGLLSVSGDANLWAVSLRLASDFDAVAGRHFTWLTAGSAPTFNPGTVTFWTQGAAGDWSSAAMETLDGLSFWTLTLAGGSLFAVVDQVQAADGSVSVGFELVSSLVAVPEPRAAVLMMIGLLVLARRRPHH
jgi:hypothetical protein